MNSRVQKALQNFGLSPTEISVYLECLKHEQTSPFALSKATGVPRTSVYDTLMSLSLKGLVTLTSSDGLTKQQTKITAKNPSIMRKILEEKRQKITQTEVDIVEALPFLQGEYLQDRSSTDFQYYPGIEGVKKVYFSAQYSVPEPRMVWENMMPMDVFGPEDMNTYTQSETQHTIQMGIMHRELIPLTDWTKHVLSYQFERNPDYITARQIRYIDNPLFDNHLSITIQGKRIYISCAYLDEVYGLIITSQTLSDTLKSMFEIQWLTAKEVTADLIRSWGGNAYRQAEFKKMSLSKNLKKK